MPDNLPKLPTNISQFHKISTVMILGSHGDTKLSTNVKILIPVCGNLCKQNNTDFTATCLKAPVTNEMEKDSICGLTSVRNEQTEKNLEYLGKSTKAAEKKCHYMQSWSLRRHIMGMLRVNLVHCDTNKTETKNSGESSDKKVKTDKAEVTVPPVVRRKKYSLIEDEVDEFLQNETPMERLQRNLRKDEITFQRGDSVRVMEWSIAIIAVMLSAYGFYTGGTEGSKGFVRRNRLTMYVDAKALHRRLSNTMMLEGFRRAIKLNKRFLGFIIPAFTVERFLSIYTNKTSALHLGAGFGIAGALHRFMLGPKGMFAGGIVAGTMGLINGLAMSFILHQFGYDQESMNRQSVYKIVERERTYRKPEPIQNVEEDDDFEELD